MVYMKGLLPNRGKAPLSSLSKDYTLWKAPWGRIRRPLFWRISQIFLEEIKGLLESREEGDMKDRVLLLMEAQIISHSTGLLPEEGGSMSPSNFSLIAETTSCNEAGGISGESS